MASKFHLASGGILDFNSTAVTLTHLSDDGGIILNGSKKLYFDDSSNKDQYIGSNGSGHTLIAAPASGGEIDLTAAAIDLNGTVDCSSTLDVTGATTLTGLLSADGGLDVLGNKFSVSASGNTTITGTLNVTGATTLTGLLSADGGLDVLGDKFSVSASGNTTITGTLSVTGATQLTGAATLSSTLGVSGITTLSGTHSDVSSDTKIVVIDPTSVTTANSSNVSLVSSLFVDEPNITLGTSAVLGTATSLYVNGAPTEGIVNYAAYIKGDTIISGGSMTVTGGESFFYGPTSAISGTENTITTAVNINPMITFASSQTIGKAVSLYLDEPAITPAGSTINDAATLWIAGAPTEGTDNYAAYISGRTQITGSISGASGASSHFVNIDPTITTANSSNIGVVASLYVDEPAITLGTSSSVYTATSLYVNGAPTEGTNNYAAYISGNTYITGSSITNAASDYKFLHLLQSLNDSNAAGGSETYTSLGIQLDTVNTAGWQNVYLIDAQTTGSGDTFTSIFSVTEDGQLSITNSTNSSAITATNNTGTAITSNGKLQVVGNTATTGNINLNGGSSSYILLSGESRYKETGGGDNYTGFKAPASIDSNAIYTLPAAFPGSNKVLQSTDAGVLSWETNSGGGGSSTLAGLTDVVTSTDNSNFTNSIALGTNNSAPTFGASLDAATSNIIIGIGGGSSDAPTFSLTTGDKNIVLGNNSFTTASSASNNIVLGVTVGNAITTGTDNVLIGQNTANTLQTGINNVILGSNAAGNNSTTCSNNVILGVDAGNQISSGSKNVLIGKSAGAALTTTDDTVAIGKSAAGSTTVGLYNTAVGFESLNTNIDGGKNTAIGYSSLSTMEPGTAQTGHNTAVGYNSGKTTTTGTKNTFLGSETGTNLGSLITSGTLDADGELNKTDFTLENTAVSSDHQFNGNIIKFTSGSNSGEARVIKTTADTNDTITVTDAFTAIPSQNDTYEIYSQVVAHAGTATGGSTTTVVLEDTAETSAVDDFYNGVIIKFKSDTSTSALQNVVRKITDYVGSTRTATIATLPSSASAASGDTYELFTSNITTGANNTFLGYGAAGIGIGNNQTSLGYQAGCSADNQITLGNSSITALRCADTTIATLSDSRDKENVSNSTYGLSFINSLRPVQYTWNRRNLEAGDADSVLNGKTRIGFLAQELQSAMPNNENEVLDLVYDVNPERLEAKYGNLIPIMAKAIQDLSAANEALVARVTALENA